jgi:hypothetical protein
MVESVERKGGGLGKRVEEWQEWWNLLLERCDGLGNMVNPCLKHHNGRPWALLFSLQWWSRSFGHLPWRNKFDLTWCSSYSIKRHLGSGSCVLYTGDLSKIVSLDTN